MFLNQDGHREVDILGTLDLMITSGVTILRKEDAECLQQRTQKIQMSFMYILSYCQFLKSCPGYYQYCLSAEDDLDERAAGALQEINELLELLHKQDTKEAIPLLPQTLFNLKLLQRYAQDVTILTCSRFIDANVLKYPGIPSELKERLVKAFACHHSTALQNDDVGCLYQRLGNSKFQIFGGTQVKFRRKKARKMSGDRAAWKNLAGPLYVELPSQQ